jgi:hypothetical protein
MSENQEVVDGESVKVIRTEPMSLQTVAGITDQTEQGLALFEERVRVAKKQLSVALRLTQPGQWMTYGDGDKQSVYATAGVSDRILRMGFGMRWGEKTVKVERDTDGVTATATAALLMHTGEVYEVFSGSRRMVFNADKKGGVEGYIKDEPNLIKSALANMAHVAVTQILGLRFLSPADFKELGLDLSKLTRHVDFQDHGDTDPGAAPCVTFGKNKGTPITELGDKSLDWYIEAARTNVTDPAKAKWKAKEEKWLGQLTQEKARRGGVTQTPDADASAWADAERQAREAEGVA